MVPLAAAADLTSLGPHPIAALTGFVAQQLAAAPEAVEIVNVRSDEIPYDLPALTTARRQRVSGEARIKDQSHPVSFVVKPFSFFVKIVQSCERSPIFAFIPPEFHALVSQQLDFRVEPMAYASGLAAALPPGLRMPTCFAVIDLDPGSSALWLAEVDADPDPWTHDRYRQVAYRLGRFAARRAVSRATAAIQALPHRGVRDYVNGRVAHQLVPALSSPNLWRHPLVAEHFGSLRTRFQTLVAHLPALTDELESLPAGVCHGDACTRNLLWGQGAEVYLIDFGFLTHAALGTDLSQLVLGEIQLAERPADDLEELDARTLEAYAAGVAEEGGPATIGQIARARAITMAIFIGLTAVPLESLDEPESPQQHTLFAARRRMAEFILDLLPVG